MAPTGHTPAGWYADPTGRYAHRWYDGRDWTAQVAAADGSTGADPAWTTPAAPVGGPTVAGAGNVMGPALITAIVGSVLILIGAAALPWITISGWGGSTGISLSDLISTENTGLFITSRIFWGGAVIGLLVLAAAGSIGSVFRPVLRVPAFLVGLLALVWQLSATLMTIGYGWFDDALHVEVNWFDGWGSGLWATTIGLITVTVACLLPRSTGRSAGAATSPTGW